MRIDKASETDDNLDAKSLSWQSLLLDVALVYAHHPSVPSTTGIDVGKGRLHRALGVQLLDPNVSASALHFGAILFTDTLLAFLESSLETHPAAWDWA